MAISYDQIVETFTSSAKKEFDYLNADGFWENFDVMPKRNGIGFRVSAHRRNDPPDKGAFEWMADIESPIGPLPYPVSSYLGMVESYAANCAHALNAFRDADWDEGLKRRREHA